MHKEDSFEYYFKVVNVMMSIGKGQKLVTNKKQNKLEPFGQICTYRYII